MNLEVEFGKFEHKFDLLASDVKHIGERLADIKVLEERQKGDKEIINKLNTQMERLSETIAVLNDTIISMNGKAQGISMTMKMVWALIGTSLVAVIFACGNAIIDLKTEVAVLKSQGYGNVRQRN